MIRSPELTAARRLIAAEARARREARKAERPDRAPRTVVEAGPQTARLSMSPARRARALARSGGHCSFPGCTETLGLEIDHTIPLAIGGKDEDANLSALCRQHHAEKTKRDMKIIAKCNRLITKNTQPKKPSRWGGSRKPLDKGGPLAHKRLAQKG